jgi:hypothetical protein
VEVHPKRQIFGAIVQEDFAFIMEKNSNLFCKQQNSQKEMHL